MPKVPTTVDELAEQVLAKYGLSSLLETYREKSRELQNLRMSHPDVVEFNYEFVHPEIDGPRAMAHAVQHSALKDKIVDEFTRKLGDMLDQDQDQRAGSEVQLDAMTRDALIKAGVAAKLLK